MLTCICALENEPDDREFMLQLYMEFERLFFYTAYKYLSKTDAVEDIVQESLVKLHEKIETIRPMSRVILAAYIHSTVRNTAINFLKRAEYEKNHVDYICDTFYYNVFTDQGTAASRVFFRIVA